MKPTYEIIALRKEIRKMRRQLGALELAVRSLRDDKLDTAIALMQHSARTMLRLSRGL
jgi:hypothetical protein